MGHKIILTSLGTIIPDKYPKQPRVSFCIAQMKPLKMGTYLMVFFLEQQASLESLKSLQKIEIPYQCLKG